MPAETDATLNRINVVGTSGTGKSTFSKQLAEKLGHPRVELDTLFWKPNWQQPSDREFLPKVEAALQGPAWILDGNYSRTVPIKWKNVTTVIWIDYSFPRVLLQATRRALARAIEGNELWPGTGNRESFGRLFFSKESIVLWTLKTFRMNRTRYEAIMRDPKLSHIRFIRLRCPKEAKAFLDSVDKSRSGRLTSTS